MDGVTVVASTDATQVRSARSPIDDASRTIRRRGDNAVRGGSPSAFDRLLATRMGVKAMEVLRDGGSGVMVALDGRDLTTVPIEQAISRVKPLNPNYFELARMLSR